MRVLVCYSSPYYYVISSRRHIPWLAVLLSLMFYILLALAALTSTISLHEVVTAYLHEEFKFSRSKAARYVTAGCIFVGVFCSLSLGIGKSYTVFGLNLFDLFDFVTAKLMLPLGGFFISIFIGWYLDKKSYGKKSATTVP